MPDSTAPAGTEPLPPGLALPWESQPAGGQGGPQSLRAALESELSDDLEAHETDDVDGEVDLGDPDEGADDLEGDDDADDLDEFEDDDEYDDSDEEDDEADTRRVYRFRADGEEHAVPLDELKSLASKGVNYTRKTQELSETKRDWDGALTKTRELGEQYETRLEHLEAALTSLGVQPPDPNLRASDPTEYLLQKEAYQQHQAALEQVRAEREQVQQHRTEEENRRLADYLEAEGGRLRDRMGWRDEKDRESGLSAVRDYLTGPEFGFSEEDVDSIIDHRLVILADKARQFDEIQSRGKKVREKRNRTKTVDPGGQDRRTRRKRETTKAQRERVERARQTGRLDDAAAAIQGMGVLDD